MPRPKICVTCARTVAASWQPCADTAIDAHLLPTFGEMAVQAVTTEVIEQWVASFEGSVMSLCVLRAMRRWESGRLDAGTMSRAIDAVCVEQTAPFGARRGPVTVLAEIVGAG